MTTARERSAPKRSRVDAADAGDHAVGRRVADQVVERATAALRRVRQRAVLDEAARVAQVGDVLARGAQSECMPLGDGLGPARVGEQGLACLQREQVGTQRDRCIGRVFRRRRCRRRVRDVLDGVGIERRERIARRDDVARPGRERCDASRTEGAHLVLHLHRLDDGDDRADLDVLPDLDHHRGDASGERRADLDALGHAQLRPAPPA